MIENNIIAKGYFSKIPAKHSMKFAEKILRNNLTILKRKRKNLNYRGIHFGVFFLYAKYFSPNSFSSCFSSKVASLS